MTLIKKCQNFSLQTSMIFDSALATLDPKTCVLARTVWIENILLVNGRLVEKIFKTEELLN